MTQRKLISTIHELRPEHRTAIREAARRHGFTVQFYESADDAAQACADAEILFSGGAELLRYAKALRWLCVPSAGVDHLAGPWSEAAPGAILSNSSGAYGVTISEHVVMVLLELLRRKQEIDALTARHVWCRSTPIRSIRGARALLIGTGDIGQEVARRLRAFGPARITGVNRRGQNPGGLFDAIVPIDRLCGALREADLVILSLPHTPQTTGLLDRSALAQLPDDAVIVNVGRGSSVDEQALELELRAGRLRAALDVFEREPLPEDSGLWTCPNLLITPHIAGNMTLPYTVDRIVEMFLEDFERYCAGLPLLRQVDIARGY